tara:strand:+ start:486 stop:2393 length:1908 start_codon:yes stop_codon:yes gene_type:complete
VKHTLSYIISLCFILIFSNSASANDSQLSEIEIQESSDWEIIVIDQSTLLPNGNETLSDGDYVRITVQVSNTGNQNINGSWKLKLLSEGVWNPSVGQNETWRANNNQLSEMTLGPLIEGKLTLKYEISIFNSTSNISETIEITVSPNPILFSSAGEAIIAITGEPAYIGDILTASILVENGGNSEGSVMLTLYDENSMILFSGEPVSISPGSSREISVEFNFSSYGEKWFQWKINSDLGGVSPELSGNHTLTILPQQEVRVGLSSSDWSVSDGLLIDYWISLTDGPERNVQISISEFDSGVSNELQKFTITLNQGIRQLDIQIYDPSPELDRIEISVVPLNWNSGQIPDLDVTLIRPQPIIEISSCSQSPVVLEISDTLTITCLISNTGNSDSLPGHLSLSRVSDGYIYSGSGLSMIQINVGEEKSISLTVPDWQDEGTTALQVKFSSEISTSSGSIAIQANQGPSDSLEIPFDPTAALLGAVSGLVLMMILLAFWRVATERTPDTENKNLDSTSRIEKRRERDNIEASCPTCSQRLSIPGDHVGRVRCPACSNSFEVGVRDEIKITPNPPDIEEQTGSKASEKKLDIFSTSNNDILSCPSCDQLLKVPLVKRPIMSRCPACRCEFMAIGGDLDD